MLQSMKSQRSEHDLAGDSSGKESACQCRRQKGCGFNPQVRKIPWRKAQLPTPVFLPGESHGQRSRVGCGPQGHKESDSIEATQRVQQLNSQNNLLAVKFSFLKFSCKVSLTTSITLRKALLHPNVVIRDVRKDVQGYIDRNVIW